MYDLSHISIEHTLIIIPSLFQEFQSTTWQYNSDVQDVKIKKNLVMCGSNIKAWIE